MSVWCVQSFYHIMCTYVNLPCKLCTDFKSFQYDFYFEIECWFLSWFMKDDRFRFRTIKRDFVCKKPFV